MKKTIALLLLLQLFFSSNAQNTKSPGTDYVQKLEYGLNGPVKEEILYICDIENDKIPKDKRKYDGKLTKQFDSLGNVLSTNNQWDFGEGGKTEFSSIYSGQGRAISFVETSHYKDEETITLNYRYVWSDDYHYNTVTTEKSTYASFVALDKNYRLKKVVFKDGEAIRMTEEYETIYKKNKIQEIIKKITDYEDGKATTKYLIQVVQAYDSYGNPTVIYAYDKLDKKKVTRVLYKEYKYYEE